MPTSTVARLKSLYPSLTDAEQRVARTILNHVEDISGWSGRNLARQSNATETAIFRLARKLDLKGYKALKLALVREQAAETTRQQLGVFNIPVHQGAPIAVQTQEVLQAYVDNLQQTASLLDGERVQALAEMLRQARLVTLIGIGSSLSVATLAENLLLRCGITCRLSMDTHVQVLQGLKDTESHVVVAFTYSGETRETVEAVETAHRHGAKTVVVTAFENSSIVPYVDLALMVPVVNPHPYRVGLVDAVLPYLLLLDVLAIQITAANEANAATLRDEVELAIQRRKLRNNNVYSEPGNMLNDAE